MHIIEISALYNGAHRNQRGGMTIIPDGWAVVPDDMVIPESYPFVDIEVKEVHYEAETEIRYIPDDNGVMVKKLVVIRPEYTQMEVISMTERDVPELEVEVTVTQLDIIEAQVTYTAMMTNTLLEV